MTRGPGPALALASLLALASCEPRGGASPQPPSGPSAAATAAASPGAPASAPPALPSASAAPRPAPLSSAPSRVETRTFSSKALGVDKRFVVYIPAGYEGSEARFPVVYLLHGLGGNETNWTQVGKVAEAADQLKLGALIVMPDGDDGFYINGTTRQPLDACLKAKPPFDPGEPAASYCVKAANYDDYIARELIAHVDGSLRTVAAREGRATAGLSMGGFGAMQLALRHQDLFSAAASHSGMVSLLYDAPHPHAPGKVTQAASVNDWGKGYPENFRRHVRGVFGEDLAAWKAHDPALLVGSLKPGSLALFLDCGDHDDFKFHDHARHLHELLQARSIEHTFEIVPGIHRFDLWKTRVPVSLKFLAEHFSKNKVSPRLTRAAR